LYEDPRLFFYGTDEALMMFVAYLASRAIIVPPAATSSNISLYDLKQLQKMFSL